MNGVNLFLQDKLQESPRLITTVLAVGTALWVIYFGIGDSGIPRQKHANAVLGTCLAITYLLRADNLLKAGLSSWWEQIRTIWFLGLAGASLFAAVFIHLNFARWLDYGAVFVFESTDIVVGSIVLYTVIDLTYREYGKALAGAIVTVLAYGYLGPLLPGIFRHSGLTPVELIVMNTVTLTGGIYGFLLQVGATWIAIFIIFAGLIEAHGGFEYLLEIGTILGEKTRSGVAQTAVVTSMFMGTMMGSSASNVATTGSFTIPLMKDQGIPGRFAAATESIASTGGQILPPIMGTAAFIMADIIDISYARIAIGGVIPALLFFLVVAIAIHYEIIKNGWTTQSVRDMTGGDRHTVEQPSTRRELFFRSIQYVIPVVVLVYLLMVARYGPMLAGVYTIATLMLTRGLRVLLVGGLWGYINDTFEGLRIGSENLAPFLAMTGALGIAITIIAQTGLSQQIAINLVTISGGMLTASLLLAMFVGLLFGLGMPTPAAYVLVATIVAPGLVQLGIPQLSAHLYLFYFALLSAITPPIAVSVAVAVGIADANFLEAAKDTLRIGIPLFLIPFVFVANSEIIFWEFPETIITAVILAVAMWALVNTLTGFNGTKRISNIERIVALAIGLVTAFAPMLTVQAIGMVVFIIFYLLISNVDMTEYVNRIML